MSFVKLYLIYLFVALFGSHPNAKPAANKDCYIVRNVKFVIFLGLLAVPSNVYITYIRICMYVSRDESPVLNTVKLSVDE